jgi:hypothetical protein
MTDRKRVSVAGGLCVGSDGQEANCALERTVCNADEEEQLAFMSSRQIQNFANSHGGDCLKGATVRNSPLGRCVGSGSTSSSSSYCASDRSLCADTGMIWYGPDTDEAQGCTVAKDLLRDIPTIYGKCGDVDCVWSRQDCLESFQPQSSTCSCENVRVGGCVSPNDPSIVFCAISSEGCDDQMVYMSPNELSVSTATDCFLCREEFDDGNEFAPVMSSSTNSSISKQKAAVVGGTVGGIVAILLLAIAACLYRRKTRGMKDGIMSSGDGNKLPDDLDMEVEVTNSSTRNSSSNGSKNGRNEQLESEDDRVSELGHDDL